MIAKKMVKFVEGSSVTRAMFEEGKKMAVEFGAENVYDFSLGNPSVEPPKQVKEAIIETLNEDAPNFVHGYMNNSGYEEVRERIAQSLNRRFDTKFSQNNIIMTVGAAGGLNVALKTLLDPGDEVIAFAPYFGEYNNYVANFDGVMVVVPADVPSFQLDLETFAKKITAKTKAVIVNNPNNPTGKKLDQTYLRCLLEHCREKNITVVLDECFIEFCEGECSIISESKEYEHLLIVRAFTKIYAIPGVRLGYLIGSDPLLLEKIKRHLPEWNLSTFAQKAGIACVKERGYIEETVKYLKDEREYLIKELRAMGIMVFAGEADFVLIYTKKPLYAYLLTHGILIRDCRNFKGLTEGYYRIAIKSHKDNQRLLKAIGECNE
ncbi:MAG: hypothetical protein BHW05_05405 [Clostridium sp. 42_12]|nr:MAG: hypothetical protein BHW05_05405 [Clostridium sp. 42_12]